MGCDSLPSPGARPERRERVLGLLSHRFCLGRGQARAEQGSDTCVRGLLPGSAPIPLQGCLRPGRDLEARPAPPLRLVFASLSVELVVTVAVVWGGLAVCQALRERIDVYGLISPLALFGRGETEAQSK